MNSPSATNLLLAALLTSSCCLLCANANSEAQQQPQQPQQSSLGRLVMSQISVDNKQPQLIAEELKEFTRMELKKQQSQDKETLMKKWHKLVDKLIDSELMAAPTATAASPQMMFNEPIARRRQLVAGNSKHEQQPRKLDDEDGTNILVLVKRKPALELQDGGQLAISPALISMNNLDQGGQQQQQQQPARQPQQQAGAQGNPVNIIDHQRRILSDGFGIRRESIFTTNNQLGQKEVPKFGSDEQF